MRKPRKIPDPSATEPPQQFASEASTRLKERVFEVAERESHMEPVEEPSVPEDTAPPDRVVVDETDEVDADDEPSGSLKIYLLGAIVFFVTMALVAGLGLLAIVVGVLASAML